MESVYTDTWFQNANTVGDACMFTVTVLWESNFQKDFRFYVPHKRNWYPELMQQPHLIKHIPYRDKLKKFSIYIP